MLVNLFMICLSLSLVGFITSFVRGRRFIVVFYFSIPLILFIGVWALYLLIQSFLKTTLTLMNTSSSYVTLVLLLIAMFTGYMYLRSSKRNA